MKSLVYSAAAGFALMLASHANAASLTITSVTGVWTNPVPSTTVSGSGTNRISWGNPVLADPSSYVFASDAGGTVANAEEEIPLGTFTHNNFRITGTPSTFLQTADLTVSISIAGYATPITSVFSFNHDETPNKQTETTATATACTYGGLNKQGVNINGCADRVVATLNLANSSTFTIGGEIYVFDVSGFLVGTDVFESFLTVETVSNSARLIGFFRTLTEEEEPPVDPPIDPEPPVSVVPLPAGAWLLLGGLGGLAALRRRA